MEQADRLAMAKRRSRRQGLMRLLLIAAGVVLALWARAAVWSVLSKAALGAALAWLLCPLTRRLERRMGRAMAAAASVLLLALSIFLFAALVLPPLIRQFSAFSAGFPQAIREGYAFLQLRFSPLQLDAQTLFQGAGELVRALGTGVFPFLMRSAGSVASFLTTLVFSLILSIYFLKDREYFLLCLSMLVPLRARRQCLYACAQVRRELSGYVRGQLIVCACVAALTALGLYAVRVPYALVLGLLMGVLDVIPYFGPIIGAVVIVLFSAQEGIGALLRALAVVVLVQQMESGWLCPRVMGRSTGLHPVTVMLSVLGFGTLFGVAGMLAAVPCVLCARAVFRVMRTEP